MQNVEHVENCDDIFETTAEHIVVELEEQDSPSLLAVKIVNSLRLLGSRTLDMRNICGEMQNITESVRWLERHKYVDVIRGTIVTKGKEFSKWSY